MLNCLELMNMELADRHKIFGMKRLFIFLLYIFPFLSCFSKLYSQPIPWLQKKGSTQQLMVDGKPFLVLGGELGNSTASSMEYLDLVWPRFKAMGLNTTGRRQV